MLKAMLSVLKTKGEKYEFINVCENVKKSLQSVVDADVPIVFRLPLQYINTEECLGSNHFLLIKNCFMILRTLL